MLRLVRPTDFLAAISRSPRLKFILAWTTFGGLVFPSAILMSFGLSEKYVLPLMLMAIVPFQYAAFCVFAAFMRNAGDVEEKPSPTSRSVDARPFPPLLHVFNPPRSGFLEAERMRVKTEHLRVAMDVIMMQVQIHSGKEHILPESLVGSFSKSTVVRPLSSVELVPLNITNPQTKTRAEMIELQRKPLVTSKEEPTALPRMMLPLIPQHG